jgi:hypothetical protein
MIVETQTRDIQRSDSFQERAMGLAIGSEAFVFNVLRKDLYSDPIGSLIREYTVNAQDEHRKFGKGDVPILIQVPNHFTPELHIRDYAGGLTEEQVFNFFGNYGASDKRESNDAVGFFGLGCKSAFAYTDSYIVKSFKDGMEYTFNIYIDETEIGKTAKISAESTTEPNGIEIIVPVKTHDINTFQNKVVSTVQYFKTKPVITGMEYTPDLNTKTPKIKGEGWEFFGNGSPTVIMGEIAYPIDYYKMGDNLESWESSILRSELNIFVNIGDVQVTASREALQMSAKTIKTIREKLVSIKDAIVSETEKSFADAKNLIEAKQIWHSVIGKGGRYAEIIRACGSKGIKWKGEAITDNYIKFDKTHYVTRYYNSRRSVQIKSDTSTNISCVKGETIYFDDTDKSNVGYKRRARTLLNNGATDVTVIHTFDKDALESFLGMSVKEFASFKDVPPTTATSNRAGGTGIDLSKRAKHASKMFVLNLATLRGDYSSASEVWDVKEVDNLKGVYIPIERFKPVDVHRIYDLSNLSVALTAAERAGINIDVPIYGIKKGGDTTSLVKFDVWLTEKIKERKELIENYGMVLGFQNGTVIDASNLNVDKLPDNSVAKNYATLYNKIKRLSTNSGSNFAVFKYSRVDVASDKTLAKLSKAFETQYPLLKFVSTYSFRESEVVKYIAEREGEVAKAASA